MSDRKGKQWKALSVLVNALIVKQTMKNSIIYLSVAALILSTSCTNGRYISADTDFEEIYRGKSYYEVVDDFGRPDATIDDGMEGTTAVYNSVSLNGTRAAHFYTTYEMRNKSTHEEGTPVGDIAFSFNNKMRCYAVNSDFQHRKVRAPKPIPPEANREPGRPVWETPRVPRTIEFPAVQSNSPAADVVSIEKVEITKGYIKFYFHYQARTPKHRPLNDYGISINENIYLEDADTRERYELKSIEGITYFPEYTEFAHNDGGYDVLNYSITFEPIALESLRLNIIEPGHSGFNFYGIDVKTRAIPRIN